jgi:hypothetical protein
MIRVRWFEERVMASRREAVTNANGEFQFDTLLPTHEFYFMFNKGKKEIGPDYDKSPRYTVSKHGETNNMGDFKMDPRAERERE